jgi:hypothetical protein
LTVFQIYNKESAKIQILNSFDIPELTEEFIEKSVKLVVEEYTSEHIISQDWISQYSHLAHQIDDEALK